MYYQFSKAEALAILAFVLYLYSLSWMYLRLLIRYKHCVIRDVGEWQALLYLQSDAPAWFGFACLLVAWAGLFCWQMGVRLLPWILFSFLAILICCLIRSFNRFDKPLVTKLKALVTEWMPGARICIRYSLPKIGDIKFIRFYMHFGYVNNNCNVDVTIKEIDVVNEGDDEFEFIWPADKDENNWTLKIVYFKSVGPAHEEYFEFPGRTSFSIPDFLRFKTLRTDR